jgi:hypothetical protein
MGIDSYEAQRRQMVRDRVCAGCPAIGETAITAVTRQCEYFTEDTAYADGETEQTQYNGCTNPKLLAEDEISTGEFTFTQVDPLKGNF